MIFQNGTWHCLYRIVLFILSDICIWPRQMHYLEYHTMCSLHFHSFHPYKETIPHNLDRESSNPALNVYLGFFNPKALQSHLLLKEALYRLHCIIPKSEFKEKTTSLSVSHISL